VAADDIDMRGAARRLREPRLVARRRVRRPALLVEFHRIVGCAVAQARARIDDHAQPIVAGQVVAPMARIVAVEHAQEFVRLRSGQHRFDFVRQHQCRRRRPCRQQAGVHHHVLALDDDKWSALQPMHQLVAVGGGEDGIERVAAMLAPMPCRHRQQVEIVIAEHGSNRVTQCHHVTQHVERARTAIDKVADQPQAIGVRGESEQRQELAELRVAALDVADCVVRHRQ